MDGSSGDRLGTYPLSLQGRIMELKTKRNAIILAHNYQLAEVQDVADYVGDSLELSQKAAESDADTIVFCGVHFMAETAAIICPKKKVLMPEVNAGCPMANMITVEGLNSLKQKYANAKVVCYVNTTAAVKAESDICCTSSNAIKIVESIKDPEIIFVPDKYLAHYVFTKTGKKIIPWNGYCPTHAKILPEHILRQKRLHPNAEVIVHPECTPATIALADRVLSTGGMCRYARESKTRELIVGTETGILHRLKKENPGKEFYAASELAVCPNMKMTTLEKVLWSLQDMKTEISVPHDISLKAKAAVDRMLRIS
ncbi:MAG: quinolinate synthase NadA [Nitrososphaeria archaeon]